MLEFLDRLRARRRATYERLWEIVEQVAEGDLEDAEALTSEVAALLLATDMPDIEFERRCLKVREVADGERRSSSGWGDLDRNSTVIGGELLRLRAEELDGEEPPRHREWDLVRIRHEIKTMRARRRVAELDERHTLAKATQGDPDDIEALWRELLEAQRELSAILTGVRWG